MMRGDKRVRRSIPSISISQYLQLKRGRTGNVPTHTFSSGVLTPVAFAKGTKSASSDIIFRYGHPQVRRKDVQVVRTIRGKEQSKTKGKCRSFRFSGPHDVIIP